MSAQQFSLAAAYAATVRAFADEPDSVMVTEMRFSVSDLWFDSETGEDVSKVTVTLKVPRKFFAALASDDIP
jgi:predicted ABC-type transport system involved in lysophospholipase L1 biosynthesis ATPase subunit